MENRSDKKGSIIVFIAWFMILLGLIALANSCSPTKRLNRLVKNNPELVKKDTLIYRDTIKHIYNGVHHDTILHISETKKDTVIIRDKQLTVRTFYNQDSLYIFGSCDTLRDTTYIERHIPYDKLVYRKARDALSWWERSLIFLFMIILVIGVFFKR